MKFVSPLISGIAGLYCSRSGGCTMVQNNQESRLQYWAEPLVLPFAHSLTPLTRLLRLARFAHSLHSLPHSREGRWFDGYFFLFFFLFCTIARLWKPAAAFSIRRMNFLFGLAAKHYLQFRAKTKISLATASPTLVHCQGKRPVVMVRRLVTESGFLPVERMQMGRIFTEKRPVTAAEKGAEGI